MISMKWAKGFTLLELMIVVAIISILASIAVPAYKNNVTQSKVIQAISLMKGLKTQLYEHWVVTGSYPEKLFGVERGDPSDPSVKYIDFISYNFTGSSSAGGLVYFLVAFDKTVVDTPDANRRAVVLAGRVINGRFKFRCGILSKESTTDIPLGALPSGCDTVDVEGVLLAMNNK